MAAIIYHGDKHRKSLPQLMPPPIKQPEPQVVEQAGGPEAGSAYPNQDNTQEEQHEYESRGESISEPNEAERKSAVYPVDQTPAQQTMIEQNKLIDHLREDLRKVEAQLLTAQQQHDNQVGELERNLAALRSKVAENATRSIEMPLKLPLHCPEGEIMRAWHTLTYDVGNLVSNHFRESKGRRTVAWAEGKTEYLKNLSPYYKDVVKEKKTAAAFIEAAIWNALCLCIFGPYRNNAPFFWAGKYRGSLRTMSKGPSFCLPPELITDR